MTKACGDCKGRGRWAVIETYSDGDTCEVWYDCLTCQGTGVKTDAENGDDFDIGGDSYADED